MFLKHLTKSANLGKKFFILLPCLLFHAITMAQPTKMEDKIDPAFRQLIMEYNQKNASGHPKNCSSYSKIKPAEGRVTGNKPVEKKYDCIIYTKNVQALKDSGILVYSVLPGFVTARVTIAQLLQMAAMPGVTYIEAPHTDVIHKEQN